MTPDGKTKIGAGLVAIALISTLGIAWVPIIEVRK